MASMRYSIRAVSSSRKSDSMGASAPTFTLGDLAERFGFELDGPRDLLISGVCGLSDNRPSALSFLTSERLLGDAAASTIPAFLTRSDLKIPAKANLICADPELAITQVAALFVGEPAVQTDLVHPTAIVAADVELGEGCRIGPGAVIGAGVRIGPRTRVHAGAILYDRVQVGADSTLHANVVLREDTVLGDRVLLHPGVVIGGDGYGFIQREGKHLKIPQVGHVEIGDDVEIGANSTVDRGRFSATRIGRGTKIDNLVQIGHNCQIGEGCLIVAQVGIGGSTHVGDGVVLAGQVGVAGHLELVSGVTVLGMGMVTGSLREPGVYAGQPVRPARLWRRAVARFYRDLKRPS